MYRLTYQDNYHVERTLEYKDYEELMLSLSGCVTLPDTLLISSLTLNDKVIYQGTTANRQTPNKFINFNFLSI